MVRKGIRAPGADAVVARASARAPDSMPLRCCSSPPRRQDTELEAQAGMNIIPLSPREGTALVQAARVGARIAAALEMPPPERPPCKPMRHA